MPSSCTCGAPLPDDARFCHRCGKPQWEQDAAMVSEPEPPQVAAAPPPLPVSIAQHITFGNPLVLRTSLLVATLTTMIEMVPYVSLLAPVLGGFFAVSLFQRRSGLPVSLAEGVKLGWLTAVFNAILLTILISATVSFWGEDVMGALREQMRHQGLNAEQSQMMDSPFFIAFMVLFMWMLLFALLSLLHMAGGALSAKFARQKTS